MQQSIVSLVGAFCPLCGQRCAREILDDSYVCGTTGFAYALDDSGKIVVVETNRTSKPFTPRVTWTLGDAARRKP
jgi:hypothetical protein